MPLSPFVETHEQFTFQPLRNRIFVNAVPKCGTMLLRNIILMFVPWKQHYSPFVTAATPTHLKALGSEQHDFFTGHMNHTPVTSCLLKPFRHVLIIRDPYSYVLSYARFFYTKQLYETTKLGKFVQDHNLSFDEVVPYIIRGWSFEGESHPSVNNIFIHNAISWFGPECKVVKYETLRQNVDNINSAESEDYFSQLLGFLGIPLPSDWRQRVIAGANPNISGTFSANLGIDGNRRDHLSDAEKLLFSVVAPTLRAALGYDEA